MSALLWWFRTTAQDVARGIDAGHAVRHGRPVPAATRPGPGPGGPFLHWVPDGGGGSRLAGDFLPDECSAR